MTPKSETPISAVRALIGLYQDQYDAFIEAYGKTAA